MKRLTDEQIDDLMFQHCHQIGRYGASADEVVALSRAIEARKERGNG